MAYNPQIPPQKEDELLPFLSEELARVASSYNDLQDGIMGVSKSLPHKTKDGMLKIYDGVTVNPESTGKETVYFTGTDGEWKGLALYKETQDAFTNVNQSLVYLNAAVQGLNSAVQDLHDYVEDSLNETPFATLELTGGWTNAGSLYRRIVKGVDLIIRGAPGTIADGTIIATLPVGFRPPSVTTFPVFINSFAGIWAIPFFTVETNGNIRVYGIPSGGTLCGATVRIPLA